MLNVDKNSGGARWWVYQRERFPVFAHGVLILAFSASAVCLSSLLRGGAGWPAAGAFAVAFVSSFISFLHLRLADEFKDFDEDCRYRPYRPVPRGLVTLRELGVLWVATGALQLLLAAALSWRLIPLLLVTWIYLGLMSREFFCREWLKKRPFTYMWSHMLIMPLIDLYATACDWMIADGRPPAGLFWFVLVSFLNGFVIEIGRKIRLPKDEETGVETYSVVWGRGRAVAAWWVVLILTGAAAVVTSAKISFLLPVVVVLGVLLLAAGAVGSLHLRDRIGGRAFEAVSGVWTLSLYLMLGVIPMAVRM